MRKNNLYSCLGLVVAGLSASQAVAADKPNIIVILADDMGYSDLGCYGGEIETPNLDRLAQNGIRYRQFYNSARSCPSRAMLMTGLYPHQAGMGWMAAADMGRPAYQGYLNRQCVTIAEVLKSAGYGTYMSGKWHLSSDRQNDGDVLEYWPNQRGFDHFYGIVDGAANYFKTVVNVDNRKEKTPDDGSYYFTHALSQAAAGFVTGHDFSRDPLFLYLAYTAPHWPLHALQKDIDKYVERYRKGWDRLREERFARQVAMGLFDPGALLSPRDAAVNPWDKLSEDMKEEFVMRMAIYAAQVDAMDQGIGRLVAALEQRGQLDNTVIMFMSDNGACAELISRGRKAMDGTADTYESYRINWANLSSTPYRQYKHYTHEGGIASPMIVHYPDGIESRLNNSFAGEYGMFTDVMSTCVQLSGATYPALYKGRRITPMQGVSLVPNFKGESTGRGVTFWEHEGNIAARDGQWKIVCKTREGSPFNKALIELYDMQADPTEMNDLSAEYPQKRQDMYEGWRKWAGSIGALPMDTRGYGAREQAYKRNRINGEFNDNLGGWKTYSRTPDADVRYSIDTVNTLSGPKTARIDVRKRGFQPNASFLKWIFPTEKPGSTASISFKARSSTRTRLVFRVEEIGKLENKPVDKEIVITPNGDTYTFEGVVLPKKGPYQLVFYTGLSQGTLWIDDVKLKVN